MVGTHRQIGDKRVREGFPHGRLIIDAIVADLIVVQLNPLVLAGVDENCVLDRVRIE